MNIAIRTDASVQIGTGHLSRCLALADELRRLGGRNIMFICRHLTEFMRQQISRKGYRLSLLPTETGSVSGDLSHSAWLGATQEQDAAATIAALPKGKPLDWLIVDHYALDARWEMLMRRTAKEMLTIDDIADRQHVANVLLDQNLQSKIVNRYARLLPDSSRRLIGPRFALLRPEFSVRRAQPRPQTRRPRLNVFFGGTDPKGVTVIALGALKHLDHKGLDVDVVVGADNPKLDFIAAMCRDLPTAALHVQPDNIEALFAASDLALGAGGATAWERCCLGVPTILVSVANNQRDNCMAMARARVAIDLGCMEDLSAEALATMVTRVFSKPRFLQQMRQRALSLVDGRGAERTALYMLRNTIRLRPALLKDAKTKLRWRNAPHTREYSNHPSPISWPVHQAWWTGVLNSPNRSLLIAHCNDLDVGVLRFDFESSAASVSIYLDPDLSGFGLGSVVLRAGLQWIRDNHAAIAMLVADIHPQNTASLHSFAAAGFQSANIRQWYYNLHG